ncbi:FAD-binding oxidoreductase [Tepidicaulis sp. LMO-SS28]|uniref:FAD-binding oxidoreductase n=1 Tax=Tepidicaulis sp. LMO-SS28 TaxID=3447455 RepID=UPI003EE1631C
MADTASKTSLIERLKEICSPSHVLTEAQDLAPWLEERRGLYKGRASALIKPANTEEVASVVRLAAETRTPIIPMGGNTGLVGGQITEDERTILLSLDRMNRIREMDAANNTMTVEAGVTLQRAQEEADKANRLFPLSLASEGTCQIGGNLATNAGGTAVLRYGNARDLVLGLEVVLADGRIWNGLRGLRKDNTGYDLKQLFLGSEGTLGIITAAVLKLFPRPTARAVGFAAVKDVDAAVALLHFMEEKSGGAVTSFELVPRIGVEFVTRHIEGARDPLDAPSPWYVLVELSSGGESLALADTLTNALGQALEKDLATDAVIAQSEAQAEELWALRENLSDVQREEGGSIKHDISVPVSKMPIFMHRALEAVTKEMPGIRPVPFGHIGDGNVHFNLSQPEGMDKAAFLEKWDHFNRIVHGIAVELNGSISAEHGVGQLKRDEIAALKSPVEMDLMRALKRTLDPEGILNPGKVVKP